MKKYLISLIIIIFAFACFVNAETIKSNPFGLDIVQTIAQYDSCLTANKNNELIDLEKFIPGIVLDIRYATNNNFTNQIIYSQPKACLLYTSRCV